MHKSLKCFEPQCAYIYYWVLGNIENVPCLQSFIQSSPVCKCLHENLPSVDVLHCTAATQYWWRQYFPPISAMLQLGTNLSDHGDQAAGIPLQTAEPGRHALHLSFGVDCAIGRCAGD